MIPLPFLSIMSKQCFLLSFSMFIILNRISRAAKLAKFCMTCSYLNPMSPLKRDDNDFFCPFHLSGWISLCISINNKKVKRTVWLPMRNGHQSHAAVPHRHCRLPIWRKVPGQRIRCSAPVGSGNLDGVTGLESNLFNPGNSKLSNMLLG